MEPRQSDSRSRSTLLLHVHEKDKRGGSWVAQSIECLTLDFLRSQSQGGGIKPQVMLHNGCGACLGFSLSPSALPYPSCNLSRSLSLSKKKGEGQERRQIGTQSSFPEQVLGPDRARFTNSSSGLYLPSIAPHPHPLLPLLFTARLSSWPT